MNHLLFDLNNCDLKKSTRFRATDMINALKINFLHKLSWIYVDCESTVCGGHAYVVKQFCDVDDGVTTAR